MTTNIIHLIVAQAKKDNMPEGLKLNTNTNTTVYPPGWIVGVDYKFEHENNFNSDEEYNSNEEYNNHNINKDNHIDTVDTNELHEILHQPSIHNIPNINNQKEISKENH